MLVYMIRILIHVKTRFFVLSFYISAAHFVTFSQTIHFSRKVQSTLIGQKWWNAATCALFVWGLVNQQLG